MASREEEATGFSRERARKDRKPRYVALYRDLKGRQRSAGTYASKQQMEYFHFVPLRIPVHCCGHLYGLLGH
jgi:hypothetical protein